METSTSPSTALGLDDEADALTFAHPPGVKPSAADRQPSHWARKSFHGLVLPPSAFAAATMPGPPCLLRCTVY